MKAAIELDRLLAELKEWGVPAPLGKKVEALYKLTYKEAYASGQSDCVEHFEERTYGRESEV